MKIECYPIRQKLATNLFWIVVGGSYGFFMLIVSSNLIRSKIQDGVVPLHQTFTAVMVIACVAYALLFVKHVYDASVVLIKRSPSFRADHEGVYYRRGHFKPRYLKWSEIRLMKHTFERRGRRDSHPYLHFLQFYPYSDELKLIEVTESNIDRSIEDLIASLLRETPARGIKEIELLPPEPRLST